MRFVKMEGCGNDYVFVDGGLDPGQGAPPPPEEIPGLSRELSDRHRGVGSDGLILILPAEEGAVRMRMWNADGTEGRLCLNGLRCVAKYAAETLALPDSFTVEASSGPLPVRVHRGPGGAVDTVEVWVGRPEYERSKIPAAGMGDELWGEQFYVGGMGLRGYGVSVGNPHLVLWMDEEEAIWRAPLEEIGEPFEEDPLFPQGVNVHLVARRKTGGILMRSWERGSGLTLACGSGAAAAYAVAHRLGKVGERAVVQMPGGEVELRTETDGRLVMTGPAREVFRGEWFRP